MTSLLISFRWAFLRRRRAIATGAAGFTAFVNLYALQSLLPLLTRVFHTDHHAVSLSVGATTLAVALASPFAGWLVSRCSRRTLNTLSVVGLVVCGLNVAAASTLPALIGWRFAQGLFLPLLIAGLMAFIAEDYPKCRVGQVMSHYVAWTIIGGFAGRWIGGTVAVSGGWRMGLYLLAILNGLSGLILVLGIPERRRQRKAEAPHGVREIWQTLANPSLRVAYMTGFATLLTLTGSFTYITFHLSQSPFNLGPDALGRMFCVYLLGVVVTPMVGRALLRVGHRRTVRIGAKLSIAGLLLTLVPSLPTVLVGLALICCAAFAGQTTASSYIAQSSGEQRTLASGLYLSFYYLGGCVGAVVPGHAFGLAGWTGCVLLFLVVQSLLFRVARGFERMVY